MSLTSWFIVGLVCFLCALFVARAIVAGKILKGKVVVQVLKELPPTKINLRLTGKEKTKIRVKSGKNSHTERAERQLCGATITLREQGNTNIPIGTYVFPFNIVLPSTIPSNLMYSHGTQDSCWIGYKLKIDATPKSQSLIRGIAQQLFMVASAPLPNTKIPASIAPKSISVNSFGFDRGSIAIAARVLDVQVGRGTNLEIFLAAKNDATASIYRVEIELIEAVTWRVRNRYKRLNPRTIASIPEGETHLPGIIRGKVSAPTDNGGQSSETFNFLHQELQSARNKVTLRVPYSCHDSYTSALIRVTHEIKITTYTKARISNPTVSIPIQVGCPPDDNYLPAGEAIAVPLYSTSQEQTASTSPVAVADQDDSVRIPSDTISSIPMADAIVIPIDSDSIRAPVATAPAEAMVIGGLAPVYYEGEDYNYDDQQQSPAATAAGIDASDTLPFADASLLSSQQQPAFAPSGSGTSQQRRQQPSLEVLLEEMMYSINDYDIILRKIQDSTWRELLQELSPEDLGGILAHVNRDTDQPRVADLLATQVLRNRFTCDFGKAVILNTAEWNRPTMVKRILPLCVDVEINYGQIQDVLSEWEKAVTQEDFLNVRNAPMSDYL